MPRVTRGNVVLHVKDDEVQHYLQLGYNVTTPMGKVLQASVPSDIATLQRHFVDSNAKISMLEAEIAKLTAENEMLKTQKPTKARQPKTGEAKD